MSFIQQHFDTATSVAVLTLARPEKYNSFNREMALQLQEVLRAAGSDDAVRCVVITGSGKGFCAGQDLGEFPDPAAIPFEQVVREHYNPVVELIAQLRKPVVALVNGVAAGAGANLALCCDLTIASESASFIQAFSKIGLVPDTGGTYFLPRLVGLQQAMGLMMLADKVSAREAVQMGMIYKCLPDEGFSEAGMKIAAQLAAMPTQALARTKALLRGSMRHDLHTQLDHEKCLQSEAGETADFREGVQAFLEKRSPAFTGR